MEWSLPFYSKTRCFGLQLAFTLRCDCGHVLVFPIMWPSVGVATLPLLEALLPSPLSFMSIKAIRVIFLNMINPWLARDESDTATISVTTLPQDVATRLMRYMNAAHIAGYTGLFETYSAKSFFAQLNNNLRLLLTSEEMARMKDI